MTLWINGDWVTGEGEQRVKTNPVGKEALWKGNDASAAQVEQACQAARRAFPAWAKQPFAVRQAVVEKFAGLLEANKAELTRIIASETSKPRWEAATEVTAMINKIAISVKAYHTRTGEQHTEMPDGAATLRHRPHGVLAVFGPYNFPGHLPNGHIVPALLAGNTVIFKPSELTPLTGEAVVKLWEQAGLPAGRAESGAGRTRNRPGAERAERYRRPAVYRQRRYGLSAASPAGGAAGENPGAGDGRQQPADCGRS